MTSNASNAARSTVTSNTDSASRSARRATPTISREDIQKRTARAEEWKQFRRDFLYSQSHLAAALNCSRRTVTAVENAEVASPHYDTLRRFMTLKQKHEDQHDSKPRKQWEEVA